MLYQELDSSMITQEEGRQKGPVEQLKGCKAGPYSSAFCSFAQDFLEKSLNFSKLQRQAAMLYQELDSSMTTQEEGRQKGPVATERLQGRTLAFCSFAQTSLKKA